VAAAGAEPAGHKSIPGRTATFEEVFRVIAVAAKPATGSVRTPFTERATNAVELVRFPAIRVFLSSFRRLQSLLEEPEQCHEMHELQHMFLLRDHFFPRLRFVLRHVFEEETFNPGSVIGSQLAVGEIVLEPKFSVGVFCQGLLQKPGMRKRYHCIGRRMD
jgi:hypothetical protein